MCGIAGLLEPGSRSSAESLRALASTMAGTLCHRGPDDEGTWVDADAGIALGHRRLSIVDLSPQGHQPMTSAGGRYVLCFNGEIYNFRDLRRELDRRGHRFRGKSDTEVVLAAWLEWKAHSLIRFNGMFAFALWDRTERELHLVRDRLGEKPLYCGWLGPTFLFGSELKALRAHPGFAPQSRIDRDVLATYLRLNYVPSPYSIYRGIEKVRPGSVVTVRWGERPGQLRHQPFWCLADVVHRAVAARRGVDDQEAVEELDARTREAVGLRMYADVPLGAFLSGGIDSTTVVAQMQAQATQPVRTFTVGFRERAADESQSAHAVAEHLSTDHTEVHLSPGAALEAIQRLPEVYDEPFADPSQLPTLLIAQVARRHVVVALSGDGGDEVFGGYNRYTFGRVVWRWIQRLPRPIRASLTRVLLVPSPAAWDRLMVSVARLGLSAGEVRSLGEKVQRLAQLLEATAPGELYNALVTQWEDPGAVVLGGRELGSPAADGLVPGGVEDVAEQMMFLDSISALPDEMLAKVDRASMAVGLETRVPLLDHVLVEHAWTLPLGMRIRGRQGKWLLRQVLHRYVPPALVERAKTGFDPPIGDWLRGPLRGWADELLDPARLRREGYLRPEPVARCWGEHLSGRRNWTYKLWSVLMFQAWRERSGA